MRTCPTCFQDIEREPKALGGVILEPDKHLLTNNGVVYHLTPSETEVLYRLMLRAGRVVSIETLSDVPNTDTWLRSVRIFVSRLRKMIAPLQIVSSYGTGYYIVDPAAAAVRAAGKSWTRERASRDSSS